jgi:anti-sigma factor RsiW
MSKPERDKLSEQEVEDLVAYLDGELDDAEAQKVEARLNVDQAARQETEALQQAWELLDHLPRAEAVQVRANTERMQARRQFWTRWWPRVVGAGWAAGLFLAFAAGFLAYRNLHSPEPSDYELARELRVIENRRLYELVGDLEFLRQLDTPKLFGEEGEGQ